MPAFNSSNAEQPGTFYWQGIVSGPVLCSLLFAEKANVRHGFRTAHFRYVADVSGWFPRIRFFAEHGMT